MKPLRLSIEGGSILAVGEGGAVVGRILPGEIGKLQCESCGTRLAFDGESFFCANEHDRSGCLDVSERE